MNALIEQETGIDPAKAAFYCSHADVPVQSYWKVERPGRILRNPDSGEPEIEQVTIRQYFARIGLPEPAAIDHAAALRRWRHAVINPWGYVGYQLGEALLAETGHYRVHLVASEDGSDCLPSYYTGEVPAAAWAGGRRSIPHALRSGGTRIIATDVNAWRGTFTGLDGVHCFADLLEPDLQEAVFLRVLRHNLARIHARLGMLDPEVDQLLARVATRLGGPVTLSGCLAAAHLSGVDGLVNAISAARDCLDETRTSMNSYLLRFSGFAITPLLSGMVMERVT